MRLMAQFRQFATRVPQSQAQVRGLIRMASHFSAVPGWGAPSFDMDPHGNFPACLFSAILKLPWSRSPQNRLRAGSRTSMTEPVRAILMDLEGAAVPMIS